MNAFRERFKAAAEAFSGKATKEQFAANILTAAGVDLEAAFASGNTNALEELFATQDKAISEANAKAKEASDKLAKFEVALGDAGFDTKSPKSIAEQVTEKVNTEAARKAVDISASRNIPPVSNVSSTANSSEPKTWTDRCIEANKINRN